MNETDIWLAAKLSSIEFISRKSAIKRYQDFLSCLVKGKEMAGCLAILRTTD